MSNDRDGDADHELEQELEQERINANASRDLQIVPKQLKKLRACLLCSLVKTYTQFVESGCENCESVLRIRGNEDRVLDCTSPTFSGTIAMMKPKESWVAKWQRINNFRAGIYAISVSGRLPDSIIRALNKKGVQYQPRTKQDALS